MKIYFRGDSHAAKILVVGEPTDEEKKLIENEAELFRAMGGAEAAITYCKGEMSDAQIATHMSGDGDLLVYNSLEDFLRN